MVALGTAVLGGLGNLLIDRGVEAIGEVFTSESSKVIEKAAKKIQKKTGVDLLKVGSNGEKLSDEQIAKLQEYDAEFRVREFDGLMKDKQHARETFAKLATTGNFLTRSAGSFIGLLIIFFTMAVDAYVLYEVFTAETVIQGVEELNAIVTFILGYYHAKSGEIISFYFGSSKNESDSIKEKRLDSFQKTRDNLIAMENRDKREERMNKNRSYEDKKLDTINKINSTESVTESDPTDEIDLNDLNDINKKFNSEFENKKI